MSYPPWIVMALYGGRISSVLIVILVAVAGTHSLSFSEEKDLHAVSGEYIHSKQVQ